ncbi:hypothetical protein TRAPUB_8027 [Trametes pubescens]|uniref:Uncharacterized protein n=1 Tax=Trametes pubescens TaxID=154538 RepID=A0A1M2W6B8_TRAPU|nr:hypothetical protein TRAPUB_8027 [Trametes pubescens]
MAEGSQLKRLGKSALDQAGLLQQSPADKKRIRAAPTGARQGKDLEGRKAEPHSAGRLSRQASSRKKASLKEYEEKDRLRGIINRRFGEMIPP